VSEPIREDAFLYVGSGRYIVPSNDNDIRITREVQVRPTAGELARVFCNMGSDEQAAFFENCAAEMRKWGGYSTAMQMQYIAAERGLTAAGQSWIRGLAECVHEANVAAPDGAR
jgi:hypothetical protein